MTYMTDTLVWCKDKGLSQHQTKGKRVIFYLTQHVTWDCHAGATHRICQRAGTTASSTRFIPEMVGCSRYRQMHVNDVSDCQPIGWKAKPILTCAPTLYLLTVRKQPLLYPHREYCQIGLLKSAKPSRAPALCGLDRSFSPTYHEARSTRRREGLVLTRGLDDIRIP
jgi:hypothetical protein